MDALPPLPTFEEFLFPSGKITINVDQLRGVPADKAVFHGEEEDGYAPAADAETLPAGEYEIIEYDATHVWLRGNGKRYWVQRHSYDVLRKQSLLQG